MLHQPIIYRPSYPANNIKHQAAGGARFPVPHLPPTRTMPVMPASSRPSKNWSRAWLVKHTQRMGLETGEASSALMSWMPT